MTPERQKQYDQFFEVFTMPGWELFIREVESHNKPIVENTVFEVGTIEQLYQNKGMAMVYNYIIKFQEIIEEMYKNELEEEHE